VKKTTRLRALICDPGTDCLVEAHNGLTAKLVEEAGFKAIWGSGLALSASMGVRDNNELSPSEVMGLLEFMADCTSIPILLDGDTGYGNFNNLRRLVRKLERIDVAGVCIEDKLFPKTNSFISGEEQPLADVAEFCGKIHAGKDAQRDSDFVLVARTEALIAGWGLDEALERASKYAQAGADAVLIHSKIDTAQEIRSFMQQWDGAVPVIVVPTTYADTPFLELERLGIGAIIYANHVLRTVITAVQENLAELSRTKDLGALDRRVAPVREIFRLQNVAEMKLAEKRYLPKTVSPPKALVLAASQGSQFGTLTDTKPKCMIPIWGAPILSHIVSTLNEEGIKEIDVVVGYRPDSVDLPNLSYIENESHSSTGSLASLRLAASGIEGGAVISYGDILFESGVLRRLLEVPGDLVLVVDTSWCRGKREDRLIDAVVGVEAPSSEFGAPATCELKMIGTEVPRSGAHGEWIGLLQASELGAAWIREETERFFSDDPERAKQADLAELIQRIIERGLPVEVLYVTGQWFDVDSIEDLTESYSMATRSNQKRSALTARRLAAKGGRSPLRPHIATPGVSIRPGSN
jgi:phosphoenolpyruvate phosphomutase